jgi:hypothetical protein
MLIRFFRSSFIAQYFALLVIAVVLWVPAFLQGRWTMPESSQVMPLYHLIAGNLPDLSWLPPLLGLFIILFTAVILNNIFIFHDLIPKNSLLPAMLFIVFMSSAPATLTLYPSMLAMLPMAAFLHQVYRLYDQNDNPNTALNIGILAAISSMIYLSIALLVFYTMIVYLIYRILSWRQWSIVILGFILPYLYLLTYYFWFDRLEAISAQYLGHFEGFFRITAPYDLFQVSVWVVFGLLMLLPSTVRIISTLGGQNITHRRKMAVTVWLAIFGAVTLFMEGDIAYNTLIYIPAAGIVAAHFHMIKRSPWNELVLLAYLLMIGVHNYLNL